VKHTLHDMAHCLILVVLSGAAIMPAVPWQHYPGQVTVESRWVRLHLC